MDDKIRGFTVIELLLVLAIAAILITIASLSAVSLITDAKLSQMRDQLLQNIEEARARSITSVPYGIQFNSANATSYTLIRFPGGTCSSTTAKHCATDLNTLGDGCPAGEYCVFNQSLSFIVDTGITPTQMNPSPVTFNSGYISKLSFTGLPSSNYLWFDRKGMPHDNNWSSPTGVTTITISQGGAVNKKITIDTAGKVTYEK